MPDLAPPHEERPEPTLQDIVDRVEDLTRVVVRQARTIAEMADEARARAARERAGADLPLLVDLLALHRDAAACAATARSRRERDAFSAMAGALERLIAGRGGALVTPSPGEGFDAATMEAVEVVATDDPALDRTVEALREPGLRLAESGRSARPAAVVVRRRRDSPRQNG